MIHPELTGNETPLVNPGVLRDFLALLGPEGPGVLHTIVDTYLNETPPVVEDLGEALAQRDYSGAAWLAHKLKGSSLSIGAHRLAARCAEFEQACDDRSLPPAAAYAAILADFTATRRTLKVFMRDLA